MNNENVKSLYDPELKMVMNKIEMLLKEHDIGGAVTLVSKTHSETRSFLSPSWSLLSFEKDHQGRVVGVRLRSKKEDFNSKDDQKKASELTCHLLYQIRDLSGSLFMYLNDFAKTIETKWDVNHVMKGFIAHRDAMDEDFEI